MSPNDMVDFANQMERLRILTDRADGVEMPKNQEEFDALMEMFADDNGQLNIPLTDEEITAL
jgi:hypothetical protein